MAQWKLVVLKQNLLCCLGFWHSDPSFLKEDNTPCFLEVGQKEGDPRGRGAMDPRGRQRLKRTRVWKPEACPMWNHGRASCSGSSQERENEKVCFLEESQGGDFPFPMKTGSLILFMIVTFHQHVVLSSWKGVDGGCFFVDVLCLPVTISLLHDVVQKKDGIKWILLLKEAEQVGRSSSIEITVLNSQLEFDHSFQMLLFNV